MCSNTYANIEIFGKIETVCGALRLQEEPTHGLWTGKTADERKTGNLGNDFQQGGLGTMKFIVDNNVGRLARWLRALGYDTLFINPIDDGTLVEIARREGRIVLTKDTGILRRRAITSGEVQALRIEGDDWRLQLAQVVRELGLAVTPRFTRCLECNTLLEVRTRDEVRPQVPPFVHQTQEHFLACPSCGRHYWQGTHWHRMQRDLRKMLGEGSY